MSEQTQIPEILNLLAAPAFSVYDGIITHCNDAAQRLLISIGTSVAPLLLQNQSEYAGFQDGCLFITLKLNERTFGASVVAVETSNVFILDEDRDQTELKNLSLTAASMRQPLSSMIATTSSLASALSRTDDPKIRAHLQQMNRNLFRMHRMLCNMSGVLQYADGTSNHMACQNVVSVVEGIFQQAHQLCEHNGIQLEYSVPNNSILCSIDEALLERGIYNMLSNAIKFSEKGSAVKAVMSCRENRIYISIQDQGSGIPDSILSNIFQRYQRQPGLEDGRFGLGLGMALVRSAARVHNGTVLIDRPEPKGTRITLSFPVRQSTSPMLRSDVNRVDYGGGWDHGLLELSDVLPADLY